MAQYTTIFFPDDSTFVPDDAAAARATSLLEDACPDYPVTSRRHAGPSFITSGSEFEKFTCPSCKKVVKRHNLDDAGKRWWYTVLWDLRDESQVVTVPCCGAQVAVKEFDFGTDAAFASFVLKVEGLGEDEGISDDQLATLQSALGCRVRRIIEVDG